MATGREIQLTRRIGEHLVTAKLGRLGYIAAPFAGNVPDFDLMAADPRGFSIPIQVKAINGPSWQFNVTKFLDVDLKKDVQTVRGIKKVPNPNLLCIFVLLGKNEQEDEFYLFEFKVLQKYFSRVYKGGRRARNPESFHCAIWPKDLKEYRDNWDLLKSQFPK